MRALLLQQSEERAYRRRSPGRLRPRQQVLVRLLVPLARGHPSVNHPDGVREQDGRRARNGTGYHGLDGSELLRSTTSGDGRLLESCARPFVPVIVDEVRDADAEECRVNTSKQASDALALDDVFHGVEEVGFGAGRFDLCACRKGNERVSTSLLGGLPRGGEETYVRAMARMPPPAPAMACCAASDEAIVDLSVLCCQR